MWHLVSDHRSGAVSNQPWKKIAGNGYSAVEPPHNPVRICYAGADKPGWGKVSKQIACATPKQLQGT